MGAGPPESLLRLPVRVRGIRLGRIADVIFEPDGERVLGFDVLCGDAEHRFLPFSATTVLPDGIDVASSLMLLDEHELAFYRARGRSLLSANGAE